MKKINLGDALTILANIGVIASIIFLAFEVRQSHLVGRAEARNELARAEQELMMFDLNNDVAFLLLLQEKEQLQGEDRLRAQVWVDMWFRFYENMVYQYKMGLFDEEEYKAKVREIDSWFEAIPEVQRAFCVRRDYSSPGFLELVEETLNRPCE